jgi:hypothetical protein
MRSLHWRSLAVATMIISLAAAPSRFMFPRLILIRDRAWVSRWP